MFNEPIARHPCKYVVVWTRLYYRQQMFYHTNTARQSAVHFTPVEQCSSLTTAAVILIKKITIISVFLTVLDEIFVFCLSIKTELNQLFTLVQQVYDNNAGHNYYNDYYNHINHIIVFFTIRLTVLFLISRLNTNGCSPQSSSKIVVRQQ